VWVITSSDESKFNMTLACYGLGPPSRRVGVISMAVVQVRDEESWCWCPPCVAWHGNNYAWALVPSECT
jgi:hypothetical protein